MAVTRRKMSPEHQREYERLVANAEQGRLDLEALMREPEVYGYIRVSSTTQAREGNSMEDQRKQLEQEGAKVFYEDVYTGTTTDRPQFSELVENLQSGDTLIVTKLDRIARTVKEGAGLIEELVNRGVTVRVLNMGILDNSPTGKLMMQMMLAFAEFERNMIMERTRAGKEIARQKEGYHEGRPKKFRKEQLDLAVELLDKYSYAEVTKKTGISRSTLARAKAEKVKSQMDRNTD